MRSGVARVGGLVAVSLALLATGCEGASQAQRPPTTAGPGGVTPLPTVPDAAAPVAPGERRPERTSFLVRAASCEQFGAAARAAALETVGPYGLGGPTYGVAEDSAPGAALGGTARSAAGSTVPAAAPKAGVDFSATNVQEAGVDEPDTVKTDGRLLVTTVDGHLRVTDVTGPARLVGTLDLPAGSGALLLVGDRALVMSGGGQSGFFPPGGAAAAPAMPGGVGARPTTAVTVVDLKDPAQPVIARTHSIDGSYVDARLVGGVARVVTRSQPDLPFPQPTGQEDPKTSTAANAAVVRNASPAAFLPKGAACTDAYVPAEPSGVGTIAVQSVDPAAENPGPAVTVAADASTVYANGSRLFVATGRYSSGGPVRPSGDVPGRPEAARTAIHAFDITDPAKARYAGSGDVPGRLLNQFSLSEHEGVLRVATTLDAQGFVTDGPQGPSSSPEVTRSQSRVSILRPAGEEWVETGAVDGLGKGERIYAVRFLGATGYVVTFRQVDPLYVLDLRDVHAPKVTGELKITGYSAYLHPAGDGRLLGIGQEASDQGRRVGPQLSLFDVGDPSAPTKLAGAVLSQGSSEAENDHHAFLFWPATGLVVAPVMSYGMPSAGGGQAPAAPPFVGAVAFKVGDKSVVEAGRITHPGATPIDRSLVVGDRLLTVSRIGVATNDLGSLADGGFVAFR